MWMRKDLSTQELLIQPDVFADISNVHLFGGKRVVLPEELERLPGEMIHRQSGILQRRMADVRMRYQKAGVDIAIIHAENQSGICNTMPIRDLGYIYSNYNEQIKAIKQQNEQNGRCYYAKEIGDNQRLVPVITLVLYYGTERWDKPVSIMDLLDIDKEAKEYLKPYILNHRIRLVSLRNQKAEVTNQYQSDFWHVANYLASQKDKKRRQKFCENKEHSIVHRGELLDVLYALSNDERYLVVREKIVNREGEVNMCILADELDRRGMRRGVKQGTDRVNRLTLCLAADGRMTEIVQAAKDIQFQEQLMKEYQIN